MPTLTIRNIDTETKEALRLRAARNGRSMEAEVRALLDAAARAVPSEGLGTRIRRRFNDVDEPLEIQPRTEMPRASEIR